MSEGCPRGQANGTFLMSNVELHSSQMPRRFHRIGLCGWLGAAKLVPNSAFETAVTKRHATSWNRHVSCPKGTRINPSPVVVPSLNRRESAG